MQANTFQNQNIHPFVQNQSDYFLTPTRWCHQEWKNLGSPLSAKCPLFEVIKRIAMVIPLIIISLAAYLIAIPGLILLGCFKLTHCKRQGREVTESYSLSEDFFENLGKKIGPIHFGNRIQSGVLINSSFNSTTPKIIGSGNLLEKNINIDISNVSQLSLLSAADLHIHVLKENETPYLIVSADDNLHELLSQKVDQEALIFGMNSNSSFQTNNRITYTLGAPMTALKKIHLVGRGSIHVTGGQEILDSQSINILGQGDYKAPHFLVKNLNILIAGQGNTKVHALDTLKVDIPGMGSCVYSGDPRLIERISDFGSIRRES